MSNPWWNISSMRRSVSSPYETLRRELKTRRAAEYFDELRGVSSGDETLFAMLDITSQTKWFEKEKLRIKKWAAFHLISEHSLNINFLCIFFTNYWWVWEGFLFDKIDVIWWYDALAPWERGGGGVRISSDADDRWMIDFGIFSARKIWQVFFEGGLI